MSQAKHDSIKADLERHGVTDEAHVSAATDAHDQGIDVEQILADVKAGVPQWLALLRALLGHKGTWQQTTKSAAPRKAARQE